MRSCYQVSFFSKFCGICRTFLSCFGAPRRDSIASQMEVVEDSQGASAQIVFASRMPDLLSDPAILSEGDDLKGDEILKVEEGVLLIKHQATQTERPERPETKTQATQTEETQEDPDPKTSKNQIVKKLLNVERPELTLEQEPEPEQKQEKDCLQGSSNHSTPIHQTYDSASEEQDINSPPCKSEGYEVLSPLLSQQHSTSIGLQDFSNHFTPIHQADDSASGEQEINSPPNWESGKFKMISPFLYQNHSTLEGLQYSYPSLKTHDSDPNNSHQYLSSSSSSSSSLSSIPNQYSQSSGGSFYSGIKTNIFQNDKMKEQTLDLLQNASTDVVNGVSDFSSLMDSITQDLKQIIEDPLYSSKSISLGLHAKSSLPSSSPSPSSSRIAPKVLAVTVLGNENQLIIC